MFLDELTQEANYFTLLLSVAKLQQKISPAQHHGICILVCVDGQVKVVTESIQEGLSCKLG